MLGGELAQSHRRKPVQHAGRAIFMPVFAEKSGGEAIAVPGFDQPKAARFCMGASDLKRLLQLLEMGNHLNHRDQVIGGTGEEF